jgi:hypothetical protein
VAIGSLSAYFVTLGKVEGAIVDAKENVPSSGGPSNRKIGRRSEAGCET